MVEEMKAFKEMFTVLAKSTRPNDKGIQEQEIESEKEAGRGGIISGDMRGMTAKEVKGIIDKGTSSNRKSLG